MKTFALLALAAAGFAAPALAEPVTYWTVSSSATGSGTSSNAYAEQFNLDGTLRRQVLLGTGFNPGGIAILGGNAYVSATTDGVIRSFDLTNAVVSATRIVTGHQGFGSMTSDGTGLWLNDYEGGNKAFRINLAGQQTNSITLSLCGSYCNGLEYFVRNGVGALVANRGETQNPATYDVYDLSGNVLRSALISNASNGSGIAFNATTNEFVVADGYGDTLTRYTAAGISPPDGTVTLAGPIPDSGYGTDSRFITDVAVSVPEPASIALLVLAVFGTAGLSRRRA